MSVEADNGFLTGLGETYGRSGDRGAALRAAHRHSRWVRALRVGLPALALAIASSYFVFARWSITLGDMQASVRRIEINRERLRMVDPKLEGVTKKRGSYEVTADYAEQEIANPGFVYLTKVLAQSHAPDKKWTRLTSPEGTFDTKNESLVLTGAIKITSSSGLTVHLTRADVDLRSQRAVSNKPVIVEALNGTINADTMEFLMSDRVVFFRDNVRVHIFKRPPKGADKK